MMTEKCRVCIQDFTLRDNMVMVKDCGCGPRFCDHAYHYEHTWCNLNPHMHALLRPAGLSAEAVLKATASPELKLFVFELWPGVELNVLATSDGRVHDTRVEKVPAGATAS